MKLDFLSKLLFPKLCVVCRRDLEESEHICKDCSFKIVRLNTLFCGKCRARLPEAKKICHKEFPYILGATSSYSNETIKELIYALKFKFLKEAAWPMSIEAAEYFNKVIGPKNDFLVTSVPLGKQRLRHRGFNQSEVIGKLFSERLELDFDEKILSRIKETDPQSEQKHFDSRFKNVQNCFLVNRPELVSKRNVVLIDDVTTSGATFLEASKALKKAGARRIVALAIAMA